MESDDVALVKAEREGGWRYPCDTSTNGIARQNRQANSSPWRTDTVSWTLTPSDACTYIFELQGEVWRGALDQEGKAM